MLKEILIIDDHDSDLLFGRIMVEHAHVASLVTTFEDATQALVYLQGPAGAQVELILLDINMPVMNGFEFLAAFTATCFGASSPPVVVMLTSSPDPQDRTRAMSFAAVRAYVVKPIDVGQVQQVVQSIFGVAGTAS